MGLNITVYCGASAGNNPAYRQAAIDLGAWIAKHQHTLIYGAGSVGMMGAVADTVLERQGDIIGVIPEFMVEREWAHPSLKYTIKTKTMSERRDKMIELGDAFIALPGGIGTLDEISEVICLSGLGQNPKPCILFDVNGYYEPLKIVFDRMVEEGFLGQAERKSILFSDNLEEIERFIFE
ncbi:MAG: TIGR00730 family Rossman fold protein [Lachnospiraceae bacterium]|nr:TIGR00730 family Rossman fold protein [Lachnospiraceae bacterium]